MVHGRFKFLEEEKRKNLKITPLFHLFDALRKAKQRVHINLHKEKKIPKTAIKSRSNEFKRTFSSLAAT